MEGFRKYGLKRLYFVPLFNTLLESAIREREREKKSAACRKARLAAQETTSAHAVFPRKRRELAELVLCCIVTGRRQEMGTGTQVLRNRTVALIART